MLISFIIPYHNEPVELLEECLHSVQSLCLGTDEYEVVVVDDGSDEPLQISKENVTVYRQENMGLSGARNTGLSMARGQYVQFVDSDDCLIPEAYMHVLDKIRMGIYDYVGFGFSRSQSKLEPITSSSFANNKEPEFGSEFTANKEYESGSEYLLTTNVRAAAWGYAFRRSALGSLRFYEGILHEDELFTPLLISQMGRMCVMECRAYYYRVNEGSITNDMSDVHIEHRLRDMLFVLSSLNECSRTNKALARRVDQFTMDYLYMVWVLTRSFSRLRRESARLREKHLFPLPLKNYTSKYLFFSVVSRWIL